MHLFFLNYSKFWTLRENTNKNEPTKGTLEAEFKEFEPLLKFETRLKYGWFHVKLFSMFQDLSRRSIKTGFSVDLRRGSNSLNSDSEYLNI